MRVKPRFTSEMVAVRLNADLIAETGNYLILGPKDTIEIMTRPEFEKLFITEEGYENITAPPPTAPPKVEAIPLLNNVHVTKRPRPPQLYRLSTEGKILLAFGPKTDGTYHKDMTLSAVARILPKVPAPLLLEKMARLVRTKKVTAKTTGDRVTYNITPAGEHENKTIRSRKPR